ncbi:hypothetical protein KIN20_002115 [Parelaphostrongylus tenuis]|uniref:Uncharacterized protein n=1 Tax=Parelaphostrongylus tenuis TaxID=148309 RepID=A0AAD5QGK1_PARTN|nr:hypothetical protein KIN20_002115 [Parelaphostrongylus tenuis]
MQRWQVNAINLGRGMGQWARHSWQNNPRQLIIGICVDICQETREPSVKWKEEVYPLISRGAIEKQVALGPHLSRHLSRETRYVAPHNQLGMLV